MQQEKVIYTYIGFDTAKDISAYFAYDPDTDTHYEITEEEYEKAMKNARIPLNIFKDQMNVYKDILSIGND